MILEIQPHKQTPSVKKLPASQLLGHKGQMLLIEDMTYNAFVLNKNFRVKDERFHDILE